MLLKGDLIYPASSLRFVAFQKRQSPKVQSPKTLRFAPLFWAFRNFRPCALGFHGSAASAKLSVSVVGSSGLPPRSPHPDAT